MTPEDFKNIAEGFQAVVLSLAALGGGAWALTKFGITGELERAKLELQKLESEAKKLTGISSEMRISHRTINESSFYVYIDVEMVNHSARVKVLKVDDFPFRVNKVYIVDGDWFFEEKARLRIAEAPSTAAETDFEWLTSIALLPETPHRISLFYQTNEPCNYLFSLICGAQDSNAKAAEDVKALEYRRKIYEHYRDHPFFVAEYTPKYEIHKFHFVGPNQPLQSDVERRPS